MLAAFLANWWDWDGSYSCRQVKLHSTYRHVTKRNVLPCRLSLLIENQDFVTAWSGAATISNGARVCGRARPSGHLRRAGAPSVACPAAVRSAVTSVPQVWYGFTWLVWDARCGSRDLSHRSKRAQAGVGTDGSRRADWLTILITNQSETIRTKTEP